MIIGLAGLRGSGKDTVGAYLIKEHGFQRKSFAEPLKRSVAALFDIPYEEIEKLKNDETCLVALGRSDNEGMVIPFGLTKPLYFRELLQRYGTESHRNVFGENFWVDQCLPVNDWYSGRKIVVTDCRFPNEAQRIKDLGGEVILVTRSVGFVANKDPHSSERPEELPYTYEIRNNGTIEQLYDEIEVVLKAIKIG